MADWILPGKKKPSSEGSVTPTNIEFDWVMPSRPKREAEGPTPEEQVLAESGFGERMLIGAGSRFEDIGQGAKQFAGVMRNLFPGDPSMWPEEVATERTKQLPIKRAIAKDTAAQLGGAGVDLATALPMAAALRGPVLGSAMIGGALAGPLTPRTEPTLGNIVEDTIKGAGLGGLGGGLTGLATSGTARGINAYRGRFADPETAKRYHAFKAWNVPGSVGDITQKPLVMYGENLAQYAPFSGREAFLKRQGDAMKGALDSAAEKIAGPLAASSKEDIGKTLARSIKDRYATNKQAVGQMYDDVENLVASTNAPLVTPSTLATSAKALKQEYPDIFNSFQDSAAVRRLNDIIEGTGPQKSPILDPSGKPFLNPPEVSFKDMRWLDKRLGALIRQADKQVLAGKMDPEAFRQLTQLQGALRDDINQWSVQIGMPEIAAGIKAANKAFTEQVLPFRRTPITRKVIRDEIDTDKIAPGLLKPDSPILAETTRSMLTPEGELAAKYFLINQAKKRAMDEAVNPLLGFTRPKGQTVLGETGPKLFTNPELERLAQLEEVLSSGHRALRTASSPAESARLLGLATFTQPSLPLSARLFSTLGQNDASLRFMLAKPTLATGPLSRLAEETVRRSGIPAGLALMPDE